MIAAAVKESLRQIAERFANTIKKEKLEEDAGNKDRGAGSEQEANDDKTDKRDEKEVEKEKAEDNKTDKRVRVCIKF